MDRWHGVGTAVIMLTLTIGLMMSWTGMKSQRPGSPTFWKSAPKWRAEWLPRSFLLIWAGGTLLGGILILSLGTLYIFVPQDLEYMQTTSAALQAINSHLVPFLAHDRTGFGGALVAIGIITCAMSWRANTLFDRSLLIAFIFVWLLDVITAVGIHLIVGYISFTHLLPFLFKESTFFVGLFILFYQRNQSK
jgi:hypothetical protein